MPTIIKSKWRLEGLEQIHMYEIKVIGGDALAMRLIAPSYAEGNHTLSIVV